MNEATQPVSTPSTRPSSAAGASGVQERSFSHSLRSVLWMSTSGVITRILNLARGIILARLLTPFDFGVYGLAGSVVGIKERVADIGAGSFLVYRPKEIDQHAETVFWTNLGLSSVLLTLLAIAAPVISKFYREPLLTPILILLGLGVWARSNASIHQNLLRAASRFRALAMIDNCSSAAWLAIAVILAWKGFGVWALVASAVAANVLLAALLIVTQGWRPRWRLSKVSLRVFGSFSFWFLGQGLAWYLVVNMANLMIGRFLSMSLLGIYTLAFNYASLPVTTIGNAMGNVAFAELPKLYDRPEAFWASYLDFSRVFALLGCFMAFGALVAAPYVFPVVFGHKWDAAILPFQILCVYAAVRCLWLDPFLARGNFRLSCITGFISVVVTAALIVLGMKHGLAGVACAMIAVQAGFNVVSLRVNAPSWEPLLNTARATSRYLAGGVAAAAVAWGLRHFAFAGKSGTDVLAAIATIGAYLCLYGLLFRSDLLAVTKQVLRGEAPGTLS